MSLIPFLALPSGLEVIGCSKLEGSLCISLLSTRPHAQCSFCGTVATRIHSRYQRNLVNLQTRQVIDVLADRKTDTSATWMATHPEIELVSRDRGGDYASAAATGAPRAKQCADRFHLLKNLGEALEGVLPRHLAAQRK